MKRFIIYILSLLVFVPVIAQTQYDYYDEEVAHSNSFGFTSILHFIVFCVLCFILYLVIRGISKWVENTDYTPKKEKPLTQAEIIQKQLEEDRHRRGIEWENRIKEKQRIEALEILKTEYSTDHIMDNVHYRFNPDDLDENLINGFTLGYIEGCWRHYSYLTTEQIHKRFHPVRVLGYERGLKEPEIWEKYGKFQG